MSGTSKTSLFQVSIEMQADHASCVADALEAREAPRALVVGQFELRPGRCEVFAHYDGEPPTDIIAEAIRQSCPGVDLASLRIAPVPDEDWVTLSQGMRAPVFAGRFIVHGRHDRERVRGSRYAIEIDAGQAFGTAHHATTRGCLMALDRILKRRRPGRALDVGTGTGVLAIAAARALHGRVKASDNDPVAVTTARDNARINGVTARLGVFLAEGLRHASLRGQSHDLVFANILARPLHALAPALAGATGVGGLLILSGLTADQSAAIEARYRSFGFLMERRVILDGWATLLLRRTSHRTFSRRD